MENRCPLSLAVDNLRRIVGATDLPVTVDLESGYGDSPEMVGNTVRLAIEAGGAGCNLEDSFPENGKLREAAEQHVDTMVAEALERARAYAAAGADGLFAPGLVNIELIARLAEASALPVNIMVDDATPSVRALAEKGVARVSHGPRPNLLAMKALEEAARRL